MAALTSTFLQLSVSTERIFQYFYPLARDNPCAAHGVTVLTEWPTHQGQVAENLLLDPVRFRPPLPSHT